MNQVPGFRGAIYDVRYWVCVADKPRAVVDKNRAENHAAIELVWTTLATHTSTVPAQ